MRRVLTILSAIVLLLVSLGIGAFTADLPFWRRALQVPLQPGVVYLPTAALGIAASTTLTASPEAAAEFDAAVVDEAARRAHATGARALLVMQAGRLAVERYFVTDDARTLLPATLIARPVVAMAAGLVTAEKGPAFLDQAVSSVLHEWHGDARGNITLRQLLEETSGLESGGDLLALTRQSPWADLAGLPEFAIARAVRMSLGNDYESTALGFRLEHEPGGFRNPSPANAQLAALVIERAAGQPFVQFIDQRLWRAVGAGHAELQLDRRAGTPAAHCCWLATAPDMARILSLLANGGRFGAQQVLPPGWVEEMARASRVSADTGLQLRRLRLAGEEVLAASDGQGSGFWVVPGRQLVILDVAGQGTEPPDDVAATLLRALAPRVATPSGS